MRSVTFALENSLLATSTDNWGHVIVLVAVRLRPRGTYACTLLCLRNRGRPANIRMSQSKTHLNVERILGSHSELAGCGIAAPALRPVQGQLAEHGRHSSSLHEGHSNHTDILVSVML